MPGPLLEEEDFQAYVRTSMARYGVTGLSIATIDTRDEQPSRTAGFGNPSSGRVTGQSIFPICTNTQLFTVISLAILVEEGKLHWGSRLQDVLSELHLNGTDVDLTLEQALTHQCSNFGHLEAELGRGRKLRDAPSCPNNLRRSRPCSATDKTCKDSHYANIWYSVAGHVICKLSGQTYATFVRERILDPLQMFQTSCGRPFSGTNLVTPCLSMQNLEGTGHDTHDIGHGYHNLAEDGMGIPAMGLLSNAQDMAKWLEFLIRLCGKEEDRSKRFPHIVKPETLGEVLKGRCLADKQFCNLQVPHGTSIFEEMLPAEYGLGVLKTRYRDIEVASRPGTGPGSGSLAVWTPGREFGIVVLANTWDASYNCAVAIALHALDRHFAFPRVDWNARLAALPIRSLPAGPVRPTIPASPEPCPDVKLLTGTYYDSTYGDLDIVPFACTDLDNLPPEAACTLTQIRQAKRIAHTSIQSLGDPIMVGILADRPIGGGYWAIYHVSGNTFWTHKHALDEVYLEEKTADSVLIRKGYVDIADSSLTSPNFNPLGSRLDFAFKQTDADSGYGEIPEDGEDTSACACSLEVYHSWREDRVGEREGDVTFSRKEVERSPLRSLRNRRLRGESRITMPKSPGASARPSDGSMSDSVESLKKQRRISSVISERMNIPCEKRAEALRASVGNASSAYIH